MRLFPLAALLPFWCGLGCISVGYLPRTSAPGDPPAPVTRIERATLLELNSPPGVHTPAGSNIRMKPIVTSQGLEDLPDPDPSGGIPHTVLWSLRLEPRGPTEIVDMRWSPASAPRCAGGHPLLDLVVNDQIHWGRPLLVTQTTVIAGRFDEDPALLRARSVLDVRVVETLDGGRKETCIRLTATGPDVPYRTDKTWSAGVRLGWRRSLPFSKTGTLNFGLSVGRWLGPVRVGVAGLFGGTGTPDPDSTDLSFTGVCVLGSKGCQQVTMGGFGLETSGVARRWQRWALGWRLSGEALFASVSVAPGSNAKLHAASTGLILAVQWLRVAPTIVGATPYGPTSAMGFELFAATGWTWRRPSDGPPVTFGFGVLAF